MSGSTRSRSSCSTRPTACSTWASSMTCARSSRCAGASARRCCSPPPCRAPIAKLAQDILIDPVRVDIAPAKIAVDRIDQRVFFVGAKEKRALLEALLADRAMDRVLVFTRTKRGADRVCRNLMQAGSPPSACTATRRRTRACARSMLSAAAACAFSSPPISPRAASTFPTSRTSSITSCRTSRRATCTASAAPRAPEPEARPCRSAIQRAALSSGDRALDAFDGHRRRASACRRAPRRPRSHSRRTATTRPPPASGATDPAAGASLAFSDPRATPPRARAPTLTRGDLDMSKTSSRASAARRNAEALLSKSAKARSELQARSGAGA